MPSFFLRHQKFIFIVLLVAISLSIGWYMFYMPGKSYRGTLAPLTPIQVQTSLNVKKHVYALAEKIGERNIWHKDSLDKSAHYIASILQESGYQPSFQIFNLKNGGSVKNIIAEKKGNTKANEIIVLGAHYDTVRGSPGADDNASGVASLLELARLLKDAKLTRTIVFAFFVNEEPPFFLTPEMGSYYYASTARKDGLNIKGMLSLESIGYYADTKYTQVYPFPFNLIYPDVANFIGFVGNLSSRSLVTKVVRSFRKNAAFPSQAIAAPSFVTGVSWSDQWSFWQHGYPAIMVTGTALFRNPNYHTEHDRADTIDYERIARVISGLEAVVIDLSNH